MCVCGGCLYSRVKERATWRNSSETRRSAHCSDLCWRSVRTTTRFAVASPKIDSARSTRSTRPASRWAPSCHWRETPSDFDCSPREPRRSFYASTNESFFCPHDNRVDNATLTVCVSVSGITPVAVLCWWRPGDRPYSTTRFRINTPSVSRDKKLWKWRIIIIIYYQTYALLPSSNGKSWIYGLHCTSSRLWTQTNRQTDRRTDRQTLQLDLIIPLTEITRSCV